MPPRSLQRAVDRRLSAGAHAAARFCDLQVDFVDEDSGDLIGRMGGRWDRRERAYATGDAPRSLVFRLHRGQVDFARWFLDDWFPKHLSGEQGDDDGIYAALVAGGRRGGKTRLLVWLAVAYACAVPGAIVWMVTPSNVESFGDELFRYLDRSMCRDWYSQLGAPHWRYDLVNGSAIRVLSGFTPGKLKKGGAGLVMLNEGQQIPAASYHNVRATIADEGGLVMIAANPPDEGDIGTWVSDIAGGVESGIVPNTTLHLIDPEDNPHIDREALRSLKRTMSQHDYDVQIRGMFLLPKNTVLHSWDRMRNERPAPQIGDVTAAFTQALEGRSYKHVVGIDVQKFPWIVAAIGHAFVNPDSSDIRDSFFWFDDEIFIERGDEVDIAKALRERGLVGDETLIICDASGDWQQAERKDAFQRPKYRGKGSFAIFRGEGYRHIVPPDKNMEKNPDVIERARGANARIGNAARERYVFADPRSAPQLVRTIVEWRRLPSGMPSRHSTAAHAGDAMTYVIWRFFPRRLRAGRVDLKAMGKFSGSSTRSLGRRRAGGAY